MGAISRGLMQKQPSASGRIGQQPSESTFLSKVDCCLELFNGLLLVFFCNRYGAGRYESLRFLDVLLSCSGLSDDLVSELLSGIEFSHSLECLQPALVNDELVSGICVGGRNLQSLVEVPKRVIIGPQLYQTMPDRGQVPDLRPGVPEHCRSDQSPSNLLACCRHVPFQKKRKPDLAGCAIFPLLIAESLGDLERGFPIATHWYGINFSVDVAANHQAE